jgi:lysophospholipase L1-like esterase
MAIFGGFPKFGDVHERIILSKSLTSENDIPNPDGAVINADVEITSAGVRSISTVAADSQIYYNGPHSSLPATAWSNYDTKLATTLGFTTQFEVHKDMLETFAVGAGLFAPYSFRGAANTGDIEFSNPDADQEVHDVKMSTDFNNDANYTGSTIYLNQYANDKEYFPVTVVYRRDWIDVYTDGYHAARWASNGVAVPSTVLDDLYLCGSQYGNGGIVGFPWWMKNFIVLDQPLYFSKWQWDNLVIMGDSWAAQGKYYTNSPRFDGSAGGYADAGVNPALERLLARDGRHTTGIGNSGRSSVQINTGFTAGFRLEDQLTGVSGATNALENSPPIAVIRCGLNDTRNNTVDIPTTIKTQLLSICHDLMDNGVKRIILVEDTVTPQSPGSNSAAVQAARCIQMNTAKAEIANSYDNIHLAEIYDLFGGATQDESLYFNNEVDDILLHPNGKGHMVMAKAIYKALKEFI